MSEPHCLVSLVAIVLEQSECHWAPGNVHPNTEVTCGFSILEAHKWNLGNLSHAQGMCWGMSAAGQVPGATAGGQVRARGVSAGGWVHGYELGDIPKDTLHGLPSFQKPQTQEGKLWKSGSCPPTGGLLVTNCRWPPRLKGMSCVAPHGERRLASRTRQ